MDRDNDHWPHPSRRHLLRTSAGAALSLCFSGLAFARPKATQTGSTKPTANTGGTAPTASKDEPSSPRPRATATPAPGLTKITSSLGAEEKELGDAIAARIKHAMASAAASPPRARFARGGYASLTQKYVKALPAVQREPASKKASAMFTASAAERNKTFGPLANEKVAAHRRTLAPLPKVFATAASNKIRAKLKAAPAPPKTLTQLPNPFKKVGFFLNEVRCVEETDEVGADQIAIGAILVAPDGSMTKSGRVVISNDFDAGEKKVYYSADHGKFVASDPKKGKHLVSFDLNAEHYPAPYTLMIVMAELDDGGFSELLDELWKAVGDEVKTALMAVGGQFGGPIGVYVGQITAYVISILAAFFSWLFDNPDDRIDTHQATLTLGSPDQSYFDQLSGRQASAPSNVWAANPGTAKFRGDGGYYKMKLHWRVWR